MEKYIDYGVWQDLSLCKNFVGHIRDFINGAVTHFGTYVLCTPAFRKTKKTVTFFQKNK